MSIGWCKTLFLLFLINTAGVIKSPGQSKSIAKNRENALIVKAKEAYKKGDYIESLEGALQAYRYAGNHQDEPMIADAGNLIGLVYLALGQTHTANSYFNNAAAINKALNNQDLLAANLINLSLAQSDLNNLDSALYYVEKSLAISKIRNIKDLIAMGTNHLGEYYRRQNRLSEAENAFSAVIQNKYFQSDWENSYASTGMARIYYAQKDYRRACRFADKALQLALKSDAKWDAVQALELSHRAYKAVGDTKTAYDRLLSYKNYSDSVFNTEKKDLIDKLLLKEKSIENNKLISEIKISNQQRKIDKLIIGLAVIIGLLIILIAVYFYRRNIEVTRTNQSLKAINEATLYQNKIIEEQNEQLNRINRHKDHLFAILSHDLRSPFAVVKNALDLLTSGHLTQDEMVLLADGLSDQTHAASMMLDSLLIWAVDQLDGNSYRPVSIGLVETIENIKSVLSAAASRKKIQIDHHQITLPFIQADVDQVRIILQNLLSNAIKFTGENGLIEITYAISDDYVEVIIKDDGVGMAQETLDMLLTGSGDHFSTYGTSNEKGIGLGMQLIRSFAAQNNITISGESAPGKGTTFSLKFLNLLYPTKFTS